MLSLTEQCFLQMLQIDCGDCLDAALDLKDARQAILQKSFIVPLISTAAMMRSSGCRITLVYEDQKELTYIFDKLTQKIGLLDDYLLLTLITGLGKCFICGKHLKYAFF